MDNRDLEGKDFSRSVGVYRSPEGADVTFLVFAFHGKQFAASTPSSGRGDHHRWTVESQNEVEIPESCQPAHHKRLEKAPPQHLNHYYLYSY